MKKRFYIFETGSLKISYISLMILFVLPSFAMAQKKKLDYTKAPTYGEIKLDASFGQEAYNHEITSGGEINSSYLGEGCSGYVSEGPDFRLQWSGSSSRLAIGFIADDSSKDATILINLPNGNWLCNDDANGLNPEVILERPVAGQIDIWIGSYEEGKYITGKLVIKDLDQFAGGTSTETLDYQMDPQYGTITLVSGFTPDPHSITGVSGGIIDVKSLSLGGSDCIGFASKAPDFRLLWTGSTTSLVIRFESNSPADDTILIINTPDGSWICNDDAGSDTLNPVIRLNGQKEGQYDIWVASLTNGSYSEGKLIVTER
jgi:hypothetical protein